MGKGVGLATLWPTCIGVNSGQIAANLRAAVLRYGAMTTALRRAGGLLALCSALAVGACSSGSASTSAPAGTTGSAGSAGSAGSGAGAATTAANQAAPADTPANAGAPAAGKLDPLAAAPPASYTVKPPADPCAVFTPTQLRNIALGKATTSKAAPPNGCLFLNGAGDVVFLYRLSTKAELPTGIESLKNGAQSAMGAPATGISIRGFPGFVVTGQGTGTLETQMAVQVGDYVLESSVPKGGDLSDQRGITGEAIATILDAIVTVG